MTWTGYRPSDDRCVYMYLVPSNMMVVTAMQYVAEIAEDVLLDATLKRRALALAVWFFPIDTLSFFCSLSFARNVCFASAVTTSLMRLLLLTLLRCVQEEIDEGIHRYAIHQHQEMGPIYAYEVDGLGNQNLMDDANVPRSVQGNFKNVCFPFFADANNNNTGVVAGDGNSMCTPHTDAVCSRSHIWSMCQRATLIVPSTTIRGDLCSTSRIRSSSAGLLQVASDPHTRRRAAYGQCLLS